MRFLYVVSSLTMARILNTLMMQIIITAVPKNEYPRPRSSLDESDDARSTLKGVVVVVVVPVDEVVLVTLVTLLVVVVDSDKFSHSSREHVTDIPTLYS